MAESQPRDWGDTPVNSGNFNEFCYRKISVSAWDKNGDPANEQFGYIETEGPGTIDWLNGSDKWEKGFPGGWVGVRVLGAGSFGIAGHWKYMLPGPYPEGSVEAQVQDIVVKQARASNDDGLRLESRFMESLTKTGSTHFPRLYGRVQRDVGQSIYLSIDQARREVHRIFMEYCEGGSLGDIIERAQEGENLNETLLSEPVLWSYFHCFAKAVSVMEHGTETDSILRTVSISPWDKSNPRQIVHFDLKPDNTLMAGRDEGEHRVGNRVVVADLGLATTMPTPYSENINMMELHQSRGTQSFHAPEQQRYPAARKAQLPPGERRYGACTNIYQVGCVMYCLMTRNHSFPFATSCFVSPVTRAKTFETIGFELEGPQAAMMYSENLRALVFECLFQLPRHRPDVNELRDRTLEGLRNSRGRGVTDATQAADASDVSDPATIETLLLEQWHGPRPAQPWQDIIPRMQEVIDRRIRCLEQIKKAKTYTPGDNEKELAAKIPPPPPLPSRSPPKPPSPPKPSGPRRSERIKIRDERRRGRSASPLRDNDRLMNVAIRRKAKVRVRSPLRGRRGKSKALEPVAEGPPQPERPQVIEVMRRDDARLKRSASLPSDKTQHKKPRISFQRPARATEPLVPVQRPRLSAQQLAAQQNPTAFNPLQPGGNLLLREDNFWEPAPNPHQPGNNFLEPAFNPLQPGDNLLQRRNNFFEPAPNPLQRENNPPQPAFNPLQPGNNPPQPEESPVKPRVRLPSRRRDF